MKTEYLSFTWITPIVLLFSLVQQVSFGQRQALVAVD